MTEIPEEPTERNEESETEIQRRREEALKRGEEVIAFIQKEIAEIDTCKCPIMSLAYTTVPIDSISGQWSHWSACAYAQADLGLRCPQIA